MGITIPERHAFVACTSETIVVGYHKFGLSIPFLDILLQESDPQNTESHFPCCADFFLHISTSCMIFYANSNYLRVVDAPCESSYVYFTKIPNIYKPYLSM